MTDKIECGTYKRGSAFFIAYIQKVIFIMKIFIYAAQETQ